MWNGAVNATHICSCTQQCCLELLSKKTTHIYGDSLPQRSTES